MSLNWKTISLKAIVAYLALLFLPYDSLTSLLGLNPNSTSQTFPIVCLISLIYVPFLFSQRFHPSSGHNFLLIPLFLFLYLCSITLVNATVEGFIHIENINIDYRIKSSIRQGASFILGVSVFYTFLDIFKNIKYNKVELIIIIATIPTLLLCLYQVFIGEFRIQGFSTEPSHLADYLVWIFLPTCFTANLNKRLKIILYIIGLTLLFLTFSTTGYLKLLSIIFFYYILNNKASIKQLLYILTFISLFIAFFIFTAGDNYVSIMVNMILKSYNGEGDILAIASITDRFFGFIGPFNLLGSFGGLMGYGFGADSVYFSSMFSPEVADVILLTKGDTPALSSLQGKMLLYGGVFGYFYYLLFWYKSWKSSDKNNLARVIIPAIFFSSLFSLAPFFLPYVWYWLAQSRSLKQ
jgi:hypothetical protein